MIFLAGLASIPKEVDDAAAIDGATGLRKFWSVSLPLQLPIATVALLFGIVFTATDMAVVYILTNGGPPPSNSTEMVTTWAYKTGIETGSLGAGAAISLFLLPVLAVVAIGMLIFARRAGGGRGCRAARIPREGDVVPDRGPFAIVLAFPFYVMVITAFKKTTELLRSQQRPTGSGTTASRFSNARYLFDETQYTTWLRNTAIIGVVVVLITLVLAVPAGYALARLSGKLGPERSASASSSPISCRRRCCSCRCRA